MGTGALNGEEVVTVAAPTAFDPLVDLAGMWTSQLAERYLPIDGLPPAKYECLDGNLIMSPREGTANSRATGRLFKRLDDPAEAAGYVAYTAVNMRFGEQSWIEPDLAVLRTPTGQTTWVPAERVLMPIEFVSASSRRRGRIDKPALCAEAQVPYFMRVEIAGARVAVELLRLEGERYVPHATAVTGQQFRAEVPFSISFDPAELLEPGMLRP